MNLLMVDDSLDILEGMKTGLDFKALGLDYVYYAQDIFKAKDILNSVQIDIMVTDIEMPHGSGLELLQWVRDNRMNVVTLFCTGFADFNYARKAIELQSFDYYLKPISYHELSKLLTRAVDEVRRNRAKNYKSSRDQLWSAALYESVRPGEEAIPADTVSEKADYKAGDHFTLMMLSLVNGRAVPVSPGKTVHLLQNMVEEYFAAEYATLESLLPYEENLWVLVLKQSAGPFARASFHNSCRSLIQSCGEQLQSDTNCFYTEDCSFDTVPSRFRELVEICRDDVTSVNAVIQFREYHKRDIPYQSDALHEWEELLAFVKQEELTQRIYSHLDSLVSSGRMNQRVLNYFGVDVMQVVYTVLKEKQVEAHKLFGNENFDRLRNRSLRSVAGMKHFTGYMIETACNYLNMVNQSQTVIDKVTDYIVNHLDEEITRASLGKIVFLNSDYLSRLFKKETGMSLGEYLLHKRMEKAKELLVKTDLPVNMIALEVGYGNFAYFTKQFREEAGVTPTEYKNKSLRPSN